MKVLQRAQCSRTFFVSVMACSIQGTGRVAHRQASSCHSDELLELSRPRRRPRSSCQPRPNTRDERNSQHTSLWPSETTSLHCLGRRSRSPSPCTLHVLASSRRTSDGPTPLTSPIFIRRFRMSCCATNLTGLLSRSIVHLAASLRAMRWKVSEIGVNVAGFRAL